MTKNPYGPVRSEKVAQLQQRLDALGIREEDLVERFIRGSGPGGQKTNKTSSAVHLKHVPSGVEVKVRSERSQALNRFLARRLLADRLETASNDGPAVDERIARLRKQKQRRQRRARQRRAERAAEQPKGSDRVDDE